MPRTPKTKVSLSPVRRLLPAALRQAWAWRRGLLPVVLLAGLINLLLGLTGDETAPVYQGLWIVFTISALVWTIRHSDDAKTKVSLSQAFYSGTAPALKL